VASAILVDAVRSVIDGAADERRPQSESPVDAAESACGLPAKYLNCLRKIAESWAPRGAGAETRTPSRRRGAAPGDVGGRAGCGRRVEKSTTGFSAIVAVAGECQCTPPAGRLSRASNRRVGNCGRSMHAPSAARAAIVVVVGDDASNVMDETRRRRDAVDSNPVSPSSNHGTETLDTRKRISALLTRKLD
jgi:hypothetical protein